MTQLSLFDHIETDVALRPTVALVRGEARLAQCHHCGTVVYCPRLEIGALFHCSGCGRCAWKKQPMPVAVFADTAARYNTKADWPLVQQLIIDLLNLIWHEDDCERRRTGLWHACTCERSELVEQAARVVGS